MSTERFFAELPPFDGFDGVVEPGRYQAVPPDWCVAVTDVEGSTAAIAAGRYKDVNALGAASIVAVLNAAEGVPLPYVFGGDGATLLFPESRRDAVSVALRGLRRLARERFDLALRAGVVPVSELVADGFPVRVARFRPSPWVSLAMLSGAGVPEAERRVKLPPHAARYAVADDGAEARANLDGFECRWEPIQSRHGLVASLLVAARGPDGAARAATYREVLGLIDGVLGDVADANPAHPSTLRIAADPAAFEQEARLRGGAGGLALALHRTRARATAALGRLLLRTGWRVPGFDGAAYRAQVVANTDFRKFDETLRMVLDVTADQLARLEERLAALRAAGRVAYGVHVSTSAVMTCFIVSHEREHVHFVDGSDGGYAMAAARLKEQLGAG